MRFRSKSFSYIINTIVNKLREMTWFIFAVGSFPIAIFHHEVDLAVVDIM